MFVTTNAPKRNAFNRCERKMAPLSKELAGLILQHDHFGTHLNQKGETVDEALQLENFEHAGKALAEVWSDIVFDGHPCVAEYVSDEPDQHIEENSEEWKTFHVRHSHFFLQIVKCDDGECCSPFQSSYRTLIPDRFLSSLIPVTQAVGGLKWSSKDSGGAIYLTLSQNRAMKSALITETMKKKYKEEVSYAYSNPAVSTETLKK